mmetsp:Transcript_7578/g.13727  ORF Transcript_7578/g.13727 Transcript_7578/m.13727 type:complete len:289 (+) Transcript_7578:1204-2070(+)
MLQSLTPRCDILRGDDADFHRDLVHEYCVRVHRDDDHHDLADAIRAHLSHLEIPVCHQFPRLLRLANPTLLPGLSPSWIRLKRRHLASIQIAASELNQRRFDSAGVDSQKAAYFGNVSSVLNHRKASSRLRRIESSVHALHFPFQSSQHLHLNDFQFRSRTCLNVIFVIDQTSCSGLGVDDPESARFQSLGFVSLQNLQTAYRVVGCLCFWVGFQLRLPLQQEMHRPHLQHRLDALLGTFSFARRTPAACYVVCLCSHLRKQQHRRFPSLLLLSLHHLDSLTTFRRIP